MCTLSDETDQPWYRRHATRRRDATVVVAAAVIGALLGGTLVINRGGLAQHPTASALAMLGFTLLQFLGAWLIAGRTGRVGPYAGLFIAGAVAVGAAYGNAVALLAGAVLVTVGLAAQPRPHGRAIRICIALLACVSLAIEASQRL